MNSLTTQEVLMPPLVRTEEVKLCPGCGGSRLGVWCRGYDRLHLISESRYVYSRCADCSLLFLSVRPTEEDVHVFYPDDYGPYQGNQRLNAVASGDELQEGALPKRILRWVLRKPLSLLNRSSVNSSLRFLQQVENRYSPPAEGGMLLDFGCGSDIFLNWARNQGWETVGVDFSPRSVNQVKFSGHRALLMSPAVWQEIEDKSLDFVRMSHVIEHLYEPKSILSSIWKKMKAGAVLHVATPNCKSITAKIFRAQWWGLECPRHIMLYSPATLRRVLSEAGFSELEIVHETLTKDSARSIGYFLHDQGRIEHSEVNDLIHNDALIGLLYVPARVAAALGVADRFHVFARK